MFVGFCPHSEIKILFLLSCWGGWCPVIIMREDTLEKERCRDGGDGTAGAQIQTRQKPDYALECFNYINCFKLCFFQLQCKESICFILLFLRQSLTIEPRITLNSWSSCLSVMRVGITGMGPMLNDRIVSFASLGLCAGHCRDSQLQDWDQVGSLKASPMLSRMS